MTTDQELNDLYDLFVEPPLEGTISAWIEVHSRACRAAAMASGETPDLVAQAVQRVTVAMSRPPEERPIGGNPFSDIAPQGD